MNAVAGGGGHWRSGQVNVREGLQRVLRRLVDCFHPGPDDLLVLTGDLVSDKSSAALMKAID
jgi:hypothetical protein